MGKRAAHMIQMTYTPVATAQRKTINGLAKRLHSTAKKQYIPPAD